MGGMKTLTSTVLQIRQWASQSSWFSVTVLTSVIALEVIGRQSASDLHDLLAAGVLIMLAILVGVRHQHAPIGWVTALGGAGRAAGRWLGRRAALDLGRDLRGAPPYPVRTPWQLPALLAAFALLSAVPLLAWWLLPGGPRDLGLSGSYTLYLIVLSAVWLSMLGLVVLAIYLPIAMMAALYRGEPPRMLGDAPFPSGSVPYVLAYLGLLIACERYLPVGTVPVGLGLIALAACLRACLPCSAETPVIWRRRAGAPIAAIPRLRGTLCAGAVGLLILAGLSLWAVGGRMLGREAAAEGMPISMWLGTAYTWLCPGLVAAVLVALVDRARHDPARPGRTTVLVRDLRLLAARRAGEVVRAWGLVPTFGARKAFPSDAAVEVVPPDESQAREFAPRWPLKVSIDDLEDDLVRERVVRRGEVQLRRYVVHQMKRLLAEVRGRSYRNGNGFWLAPHLTLLDGVIRDEPESAAEAEEHVLPRVLGTPYRAALHGPARRYLHTVMRALQVDLIFIEDGISARRLARVLRAMFDAYDRLNGRRIEEVHLTGLPQVRVVLHDLAPETPYRSNVYPEPKFEDLARARLMQVFKDRGGLEDWLDSPFDRTSSPAPAKSR